jgi:bifunctional non-homologous end joining protein LigD
MALETYRKKRNFKATAEPAGSGLPDAAGHSFVVQKHAARRLHYDFRLEMDGVLKSWAVTRGPSLVPGEKRLAVHVEDHPLEYGDFEGTIPKGEYGGGAVIVWDRGRWRPIGDPATGYAKGHLDFELDGAKLGGRWHLVRMAAKPRDRHENWLLIKGDDAAARPDGTDILDERPESVKTGRPVEEIAGEAPGWSSKTGKIDKPTLRRAEQQPLPSFIEPALATLAGKPPSGARWLHEIKFDGYRLQARIEARRVTLLTRTGLDWTGKFGTVVAAAFMDLPADTALIDGELVVENDHGASDFSALQADLSAGRRDRFVFYAFDLLHLDGVDLRQAPLTERKTALERLLAGQAGVLRFSESFDEDGAMIIEHACRLSLEGVVSKRRDAPYRSGRGKDWIKSKCRDRQEFAIGGYVPSTVSRRAVGSLVLGYYDGDRLIHVGRVGTGFTLAVAEELFRRLAPSRTADSPFAEALSAEAARQVRFVDPNLVAEVEFHGWTADRQLRHAAFRGLREDKPALEIVREEAQVADDPSPRPAVKLTHPDRLYWPDAGVTKAGLADYYAEIWRFMAPFAVGRPLALVRCPGGITDACFFQKHIWQGASPNIRRQADPKDPKGEEILSIDDLDGMIGLVQAGVLEIHPWGSTLAAIEQPDMLVMDLDPAEEMAWPDVIAAARDVRERLEQRGLASFVKTSGGKGLHVVAPLVPAAEWDAVKRFTKDIADAMAADQPARYVSVVTKAKRHGKILIDYLRNGRGATAVAPYSTRARAGAPVSMPLAWDELDEGIGPAYFTVGNAVTRLSHLRSDPWGGFRQAAAALPATAPRRRSKKVS